MRKPKKTKKPKTEMAYTLDHENELAKKGKQEVGSTEDLGVETSEPMEDLALDASGDSENSEESASSLFYEDEDQLKAEDERRMKQLKHSMD